MLLRQNALRCSYLIVEIDFVSRVLAPRDVNPRGGASDSTYCYFLQKSGTNKAIKVMISRRPANIISDITHFPKAGKKS